MGRPRSGTHAVPTPTRIPDAAEAAFGAHPFAQARLADIAREAGVRRSSLLYHYTSKDALHTAVVDRLFEDLIAAFSETVAEGGDLTTTIDRLFGAWLSFLADRPAFAPLVLRGILDGHGPVRDHLRDRLVPLIDRIEGWIREAGVAPQSVGVRAALLQIGSDTLVRASAGPLQGPLWGTDHPLLTVRRLFDLPLDVPLPD